MVRVNGSSNNEMNIELRRNDFNIQNNGSIVFSGTQETSENSELNPSFNASDSDLTVEQQQNVGSNAEVERISNLRTMSEEQVQNTRNIRNNYKQGEFGNCVGVAIFQAFTRLELGEEYLNQLVSYDANSRTYSVKLYTYNNALPDGTEKIITIPESVIKNNKVIDGNDYVEALCCAMYKDAGNLDDAGNFKQGDETNRAEISMHERASFYRLTGLESNCSHGSNEDLKALASAIESGRTMLLTTAFRNDIRQACPNIVVEHAYSVVDIDIENDKIVLKNPWYEDVNQTVTMSIKDFQKYNTGINIIEMSKNNETGKFEFSNPDDIGVKPGELDYGDYFKIIAYEPTMQDYLNYMNNKEHRADDLSSLSFWATFDPDGYEKYTKDNKTGKVRISQESMQNDLPISYELDVENKSPLSLIKYYLKNNKLPYFNSPKLRELSAQIEEWVKSEIENTKYSIQIDHFYAEKAAEEERLRAEEERLRLENKARERAEAVARQKEIQARKENAIVSFHTDVFSTRPEGFTKSVVPSEIAEYKKMYSSYQGYSYNPETRTLTTSNIWGGKDILKFDAKGRVLSYQEKGTDGKVVSQKKYKYFPDGTRMIEDKYGKTLEVYDEKGVLVQSVYAPNSSDENKEEYNASVTTYSVSPDDPNTSITSTTFRKLTFDKEGSPKVTYSKSVEEMTKNSEDNVVRHKIIRYSIRDDKEYLDNSILFEDFSDNASAEYYNDKFIGIRYKGQFYDVEGKARSGFTYDYLPTNESMTPDLLLEKIKASQ